MYEAKGMVSIVDAAYLRCYLRIDDTSEDLFLEELGRSATENLEHRLKRHIIARDEGDSDAARTRKTCRLHCVFGSAPLLLLLMQTASPTAKKLSRVLRSLSG